MNKVLVIDDDFNILEISEKMLRILGFDVDTLDSGQRAIDLYRDNYKDYCFIIVDLSMPEVDGITVIDEIRKINKDAIIIVASGYASLYDINSIHCSEYIAKPFTIKDLKNVISKVYRI